MSQSCYEKVRLAHGLPWEKMVRKKGLQPMRGPFFQGNPKVLFKALLEKVDQLVFHRYFDQNYLEFYFLDGY